MLADNIHEISSLIKLRKMAKNLKISVPAAFFLLQHRFSLSLQSEACSFYLVSSVKIKKSLHTVNSEISREFYFRE